MEHTLHLAFDQPSARSISDALAIMRRPEPVIALVDNLSYGPIRDQTLARRRDFYDEEWAYELDTDFWADVARFWADATVGDHVVAWFSSRCVRELTGLMQLVHLRTAPVSFVNVADLVVSESERDALVSSSMAFVSPREIVSRGLIDLATQADAETLEKLRTQWGRLRAEDAPLRILTREGIQSVAITYFDDTLLAHTTKEWSSCARIVGDAHYAIGQSRFDQTTDGFLWTRLRALIASGLLEASGDIREMSRSKARSSTLAT